MLAFLLPYARSCRLVTLLFFSVFFLCVMVSSVAVAETSAMPAALAGPYGAASQHEHLLADIFSNTRPDVLAGVSAGFSGLPERHGGAGEHGLIWALESGPELVNKHFGLRLGGRGTWYAPSQQFGLRIDAAMVQSEQRLELSKFLLSTGTKLADDIQLSFSAGWLQRYVWENLASGVDGYYYYYNRLPESELGTDLSQYVMGVELKRQLQPQGEGLLPGVSVSLSGLYFQGDSSHHIGRYSYYGTNYNEIMKIIPKEHTVYPIYESLYDYNLGSGYQYESLVGIELFWPSLTLDLRAGVRHKYYDSVLGYASSKNSDAPKAVARLTLPDVLSCELSAYYSWDPEFKVVGGDVRRAINQNLSLVARAEIAQNLSLPDPDDARYFFGIEYSFGAQSNLPLAAKSTLSTCNINNELQTTEQHSYAYNDWLKPVHGSNVEHLMVVRRVSRVEEVRDKWGLPRDPPPLPPLLPHSPPLPNPPPLPHPTLEELLADIEAAKVPWAEDKIRSVEFNGFKTTTYLTPVPLYKIHADTVPYKRESLYTFREKYCEKKPDSLCCLKDCTANWLLQIFQPWQWNPYSTEDFFKEYCVGDGLRRNSTPPKYCSDLDAFIKEYNRRDKEEGAPKDDYERHRREYIENKLEACETYEENYSKKIEVGNRYSEQRYMLEMEYIQIQELRGDIQQPEEGKRFFEQIEALRRKYEQLKPLKIEYEQLQELTRYYYRCDGLTIRRN